MAVTALLCRLLIVAALATAVAPAFAFTARLDVQADGRTMSGTLTCAPGGAVTGDISLSLPTTDRTGPQFQAGGRAVGRYQFYIRVNAAYDPQVADAIGGLAELSGTFTGADGVGVNLRGTPTVSGSGSEGLGSVTLEFKCEQMSCDGGGLTTPQALTLRLPPFAVDGPDATQPTTTPVTPAALPPGSLLPKVPEGTPIGQGGLLELPAFRAALGDHLQADKRGVEASAALPADCPQVYLHLRVQEPPAQGVLQVVLYYQGRVKQRNLIPAAANDEFVITFYPTDAETFPAGQWAVVVKAGEATLGLVPFVVGP